MKKEHVQLTRHFNSREFDSPDVKYSGNKMDLEFVMKLQDVRYLIDTPLVITSGFRTEAYNEKIGGSRQSSHLQGLAADVSCRSNRLRMLIIRSALLVEILRIGIYENHIHLDIDRSKGSNILWLG